MSRYKRIILIIAVAAIATTLLAAIVVAVLMTRPSTAPKVAPQSTPTPKDTSTKKDTAPAEAYTGRDEIVADTFTVKVPNGWKASIADAGTFRAVMFARPEQLNTLTYDASTQPVVDRGGIPAWNGLTEHFFITTPTAASQFNPNEHREVTSNKFTFEDGTVGTKYDVIKRAEEAAQYGGLLRDDQWQGRTYIYEKAGERVEAHLALYPSSKIDKVFYESVVKSITLN